MALIWRNFLLGKSYEVYGAFRGGGTTALINDLDDSKLQFLAFRTGSNMFLLNWRIRSASTGRLRKYSRMKSITSPRRHRPDWVLKTGVDYRHQRHRRAEDIGSRPSTNPKIKFFQASSNDMFAKVQVNPQNEKTAFYPANTSGIGKVYGHMITVNYRESYDIFACSGICSIMIRPYATVSPWPV